MNTFLDIVFEQILSYRINGFFMTLFVCFVILGALLICYAFVPHNNRRASIDFAQTQISNISFQYMKPLIALSKKFNDKVETVLIENCKSPKDISLRIAFELVSEKLINNKKVFLFKFKFNKIKLPSLTQNDLLQLNKIQLKNDVIIVLDGKESIRSMIYWKGKTFKDVLSLKPYCDDYRAENPMLYQFVVNFLVHCLLIGQSGITSNYKLQTGLTDIDLNCLADDRNYNLLLIAAEQGNAEIVNILLHLRMNTSVNDIDAQTLAWQNNHHDVLLVLLKANLTYPRSFDGSKCSGTLKDFYKNSDNLHNAIKAINMKDVKKILDRDFKLKYFYNKSNDSALKAAIEAKSPEIYDILLNYKLRFAPHEDVELLHSDLEPKMQRRLRDIHLNYTQQVDEKHIHILMAYSCVSHDDENTEENIEHIRRAFRIINKNSLIKVILTIVAASENLKIIFDFNRDSVNFVDPAATPHTLGLCYFIGRIYIGAKQLLNRATEHQTFGVLAHELCHYAMVLTYDNKAKPYRADDIQTKEKFDIVSKKCHENSYHEEIVNLVYTAYEKELHHVELIVRVVHMLAFYYNRTEKQEELRRHFFELFNIYETKIVPEIEAGPSKIKTKVEPEVEPLNKKEDKTKFSLFIWFLRAVCIIITPCIIYWYFYGFNIFTTSQNDWKWENLKGNKRENFLGSNVNFQGEIVQFKVLYEAYPDAFNALTSPQINDVLNGKELKIGRKFVDENKFYVERKFIPEDAKSIRFEYQYGHEYVVNYETEEKHVQNREKAKYFQEFLNEFLKKDFDEILQIFNKVRENSYFKTLCYDLNSIGFKFTIKNSFEIIRQAEKEKILILSSEAGSGKTATFEELSMEIKSKFPTRWVSYIDLPRHTELYRPNTSAENLLKNILNLNSEINNLEVRIFEKTFKSGNLVLIWNAFDEISPTYNEFILNIFKSIHETKNVQFVCTRPLYSDQLSKEFKVLTWKLFPFDKEKKKEFLKEFFIAENVLSKEIQKKIHTTEIIISKFSYEKNFLMEFNTPLMLELIAQTYDDENLFQSANTYGIFEAFVEKKIELLFKKNKTLFSKANKLLSKYSLMLILQKYALLNTFQIFGFSTLYLKLRKLQIMEKKLPENFPIDLISQMGILYINGKNNFQFSHKTLSEFFVAQFFIENIFDVDGSLDSDEAELRLELFFHLTHQYGICQRFITDFMTSYLQMRTQNPKKFNPTISKLLRTKFKKFFIRMLDTNYPKVFEFLFEFFKPDHDILVDLLHVHEPETFYTAIFNPNYFALFTNPEDIISLAQNCLTDLEFQKFQTGQNQKGKIIFGIVIYWFLDIIKSHVTYQVRINGDGRNLFWVFIIKIKEHLTIDEQKELFVTALSPKIYLFYDKLFSTADFYEYEKYWSNFEKLLTKTEMKEALKNALLLYYEICPYGKAGNENFLNLLLKKIEKFLSNWQIFEIFLTQNIFHEAHWDPDSVENVWNFFSIHTNDAERRKILLQDDLEDKNFYFFSAENDLKKSYSSYQYPYFYYDFTPFKIFHRAWIYPIYNFHFTKEIYQNHFNKSEIQEIILSSNDFLYYVIGRAEEEPFKKFVEYLAELFKGNEKLLKEFLERKIEPTNLSVFEFVEDFRGLSYSEISWFTNLQILKTLYNNLLLKV